MPSLCPSWIAVVVAVLLLSLHVSSSRALKCFSCASYEYRVLFERDSELSRNVRVPKFDRLCDMEEMVQGFAPVDVCHSTCVTIFEPQYFGGLQSLQRPFLYIRGCADHIFSAMDTRPIEVEFLHRSPICVRLQLSQIYPQVQANEIVQVCSCAKDGCNYSSTNSSPQQQQQLLLPQLAVLTFCLVALLR